MPKNLHYYFKEENFNFRYKISDLDIEEAREKFKDSQCLDFEEFLLEEFREAAYRRALDELSEYAEQEKMEEDYE